MPPKAVSQLALPAAPLHVHTPPLRSPEPQRPVAVVHARTSRRPREPLLMVTVATPRCAADTAWTGRVRVIGQGGETSGRAGGRGAGGTRGAAGPMGGGGRAAGAGPPGGCGQPARGGRGGGERCLPRGAREPRRKGWAGRLGVRLGSRGLPVGSDSPAVHGSQPFSSGRSHRLADANRPLPPARFLRPRPHEHQPLRCATSVRHAGR